MATARDINGDEWVRVRAKSPFHFSQTISHFYIFCIFVSDFIFIYFSIRWRRLAILISTSGFV